MMFGQGVWIEVLEDQSLVWAGCWEQNEKFHFWVETQYGEIVDLNTSVAFRATSTRPADLKVLYSPPILWSSEVPWFYRYIPQGIAELELHQNQERQHYEWLMTEVDEKCRPDQIDLQGDERNLQFPNESILCPGRRVLDDSRGTFRFFDRALSVQQIPPAPVPAPN
jgi:hypothetical protein